MRQAPQARRRSLIRCRRFASRTNRILRGSAWKYDESNADVDAYEKQRFWTTSHHRDYGRLVSGPRPRRLPAIEGASSGSPLSGCGLWVAPNSDLDHRLSRCRRLLPDRSLILGVWKPVPTTSSFTSLGREEAAPLTEHRFELTIGMFSSIGFLRLRSLII